MRRRFVFILIVCFLLLQAGALAGAAAGGWNGYPTVNVRVNGKPYTGAVPAILVENYTFLPLRGLAEALGMQVAWDGATRTVLVTSPPDAVARAEAAEARAASLERELEQAKAELQAVRKELEATRAELQAARKELEDARKQLAQRPPQGASTDRQAVIARVRPAVFKLVVLDATGREVGSGSAVAVAEDLLVTNYHVIEDAAQARAVAEDGRTIPVAGLAAADPAKDLALLKVDARLVPAEIRLAPEPQVGEEVIAIGSPKGLTNTVSTGIVSGLRDWKGIQVFQTTAPISPGSSGGGLFDAQGRLIGVTFGYLEGGQNLNFAIPMAFAQPLIQSARYQALRPLPGRVNPENLLAVIRSRFPEFSVGGRLVRPEFYLVPRDTAAPGEAPQFVVANLKGEPYLEFLTGMLSIDLRDREREVEAYLEQVAEVVQQAYPGQKVLVTLVHIDSYSFYPTSYKPSEVRYADGRWHVTHLIAAVKGTSGNWSFVWNR